MIQEENGNGRFCSGHKEEKDKEKRKREQNTCPTSVTVQDFFDEKYSSIV